MKSITTTILFLMITAVSPSSYADKILKDYSDSATGYSKNCYAEKIAIDVAQTNARNNLVEKCKHNGWRSVTDVSYAADAFCHSCVDGIDPKSSVQCDVVAKGWCYKMD